MTQDEIIEMAVQAGMAEEIAAFNIPIIEAFAKLVAAKAFQDGYEKGVAAFNEAVLIEREACAKVCEEAHWSLDDCAEFAKAIRARGEATHPPQRTEQDWDALAEKQLASIKRDMKATFEDAVVRATHKVMAEFEAQAEQEPPKYSFKAYWEANGRIGVVACIVRPDGGVHLMSEILDLPPSTEPQHTPEHQARIAAFKDAMHAAKEKNT